MKILIASISECPFLQNTYRRMKKNLQNLIHMIKITLIDYCSLITKENLNDYQQFPYNVRHQKLIEK